VIKKRAILSPGATIREPRPTPHWRERVEHVNGGRGNQVIQTTERGVFFHLLLAYLIVRLL
jgi:hypothetical protein